MPDTVTAASSGAVPLWYMTPALAALYHSWIQTKAAETLKLHHCLQNGFSDASRRGFYGNIKDKTPSFGAANLEVNDNRNPDVLKSPTRVIAADDCSANEDITPLDLSQKSNSTSNQAPHEVTGTVVPACFMNYW